MSDPFILPGGDLAWDDPPDDDHDGPGWDLEQIWDGTPRLKAIRDLADATGSGRWSLLGCLMARAVAEIPPWVKTPAFVFSRQTMNLYVGLVGASGAGKSGAIAVSAEPFALTGRVELGTGTGEGLTAAFMEKVDKADIQAGREQDPPIHIDPYRVKAIDPHVLANIDEIGQLTALSQRGGSTIDSTMRTMWSGAAVNNLNASPETRRHLPAHSYRLAVIAGIQPLMADSLLNKKARAAGTAQRWLWLPVDNPYLTYPYPKRPPMWTWRYPGDELVGREEIGFPEDVWGEVQLVNFERSRTASEEDAIRAHDMLCRVKVAAALAVLHEKGDVDDKMWGLSDIIMRKSHATRQSVEDDIRAAAERDLEAKGAGLHRIKMGEDEAKQHHIERVADRVALLVSERHKGMHDGAGCTMACVSRDVASRDRDYKEPALAFALEVGMLECPDPEAEHPHYLPGPRGPRRD